MKAMDSNESKTEPRSPLDVEGVDASINREEIVELIHAGRREESG